MFRGTSELRKKVLGQIKSDDFRLYVIWVPMLPADNEDRVPAAVSRLTDKRVTHNWDEKAELPKSYEKILKMEEPAWDVYYLYDRGVTWKKEPPKPEFYMHQLSSLPKEFILDGDRLASEINKLIKKKTD